MMTTPGGDVLAAAITRAHGILPDQGPIGVFVHHNTLHAFQHHTFHEGVQEGAALLGARPYPEIDQFRAWFQRGRVEAADVDAELRRALGERADERLAMGLTRGALWRLLLLDAVDGADEAGMRYLVEAALPLPVDRARVAAAQARLGRSGGRPAAPLPPPHRHRDALLRLGGPDVDLVVHPELVRLSASFLDQGQAAVAMPHRAEGFLRAVASVSTAGFPPPAGCRGLADDLREVLASGQDAEGVVRACLQALGVGDEHVAEYLLAAATALRGWAGMFARLERNPEEATGGPPISLMEYLAVRLLLERRAVAQAVAELGLPLAWPELRARVPARGTPRPTVDAVLLAQVAAAAGLGAAEVDGLPDEALAQLWAELGAFPDVRRRQLWLEAYERRYRRQILDALHARRLLRSNPGRAVAPRGQLVFCIDEREESIRRAIEEQGPAWQTFGVAGFFGLAIDYTGLDDHKPAAHCPVVVVPAHEVSEGVVARDSQRHSLRRTWRRVWNRVERGLADLSRTLAGGAGLALAVGPLAGALTAARIFAPRGSVAMRARFEASIAPHPTTRLSAVRQGTEWSARGKPVGFSLEEAADRIAALLKNIGLVKGFAPIVVMLGHGSTSLNNPHESAHDCGACGGRRGGANARLFADLANRPDVRQAVAARGVVIPDETWFIGALHDTSDDGVTVYDLDAMPPQYDAAYEAVRQMLEVARRESARERCRRFDDAPLGIGPDAALAHVQGRASHLAQPRPEYGHCTNAIAVVGRRALTRGLYLDRRSFLISYDPTIDADNTIIERILAAVGPVGAGISLEYYFSSVDNEVFGCGTKLPHNVTSLIGVMNGHQGDLRTGLPLQMVEIHESMRLLLVVEASPEALLAVAGRQAEVRELVVNRWVQLVSVHPETGELQVFGDSGFEHYDPAPVDLPRVQRSVDWYGRSREHLPPAFVAAGLGLGEEG